MPIELLPETPSQTAGPYVHIGLALEAAGNPTRDQELWQADANGEYQDAYNLENAFNSFGRTATTFDAGEWTLHTVKPGVVNNAAGVPMAPHINISLFARGINIHLHTRLYFDDEAQANAKCPVLNLIEQPQRRETLIAKRCEVDGKTAYRFDIRIQGEGETVFFDF
jgi:protocatechuate 3,4-dioxygenase alpha subunit